MLFKMSDDELFALESAKNKNIFTFHTYQGTWKRIKVLKTEHKVLEKFLFTIHDTRRTHSKALQDNKRGEDASKLLGHSKRSTTAIYAGKETLNIEERMHRYNQQKQTENDTFVLEKIES